jgi:hypothetical protein
MKAFLSFLAIPLIFIANASADLVIESKIESAQLNSTTTIKVKGGKMRVDIPDGPIGAMSSIIDTATGDSIALVHAQKMAMKTSSAQLKQALDANKPAGDAKSADASALKATGQKEKISGYDCEIYTWSNGGATARLWVTKDHPQAAALKTLEKQMHSGIMGAMQTGPDSSSIPGVAVKTELTNQGQTITTTILSVKEQDVDAKEFDIPAGYQSMAMPGGLGGK